MSLTGCLSFIFCVLFAGRLLLQTEAEIYLMLLVRLSTTRIELSALSSSLDLRRRASSQVVSNSDNADVLVE